MNKRFSLLTLALLATAFIWLGLMLSYYLNLYSNPFSSVIPALVIIAQIVLPIYILESQQIPLKDFNIYAFGLEGILDFILRPKAKEKPQWYKAGQESLFSFAFCALIFIPYVLAYWGWQYFLATKSGEQLFIKINLPPNLSKEMMIQLLVIAMPEEIFYRGFLQEVFFRRWPKQIKFFGLPMGKGIILTNTLFAAAHLLNGFNPLRLLTFFPGLVFSWLVYKRKNLLSAIIFHAACNLLGQVLYASIFAG